MEKTDSVCGSLRCRGEVRTIISARAFVEQAKLGEVLAGLEGAGLAIVYLEEVGAGIGAFAKLRALVATR